MTVYLIDGYNVLHQLVAQTGDAGRGDRDRGEADRAGRSGRRQADGRLHGQEGKRRGPAGRGAPGRHAAASHEGAPAAPPGSRGLMDLEDQRRHLIDRIASYMGGTSDRAIVVFDAHSQTLQKTESATANVEVFFGSFSQSADSIIEREVYALSAGESVVVVSSDYQLQKTIFLPNVIRRSSRQFVGDLQEHTKRIANSQNCITMNHRIEERIDPGTADRLRALRDELAAGPEEPGHGSEA
jgi:predicted RNA-binding protein with PIN domain